MSAQLHQMDTDVTLYYRLPKGSSRRTHRLENEPVKRTLANGLRVLTHPSPAMRSVAFAICFLSGSQEEKPETVGKTHLLEHLLFRRTVRRSTRDIASLIDELGGELNAFTDTDSLCIYGNVPLSRFGEALELSAELIREPGFTESDVALEKEVVRQEILDAADNPPDASSQRFCQEFWKGSIFGYPVFGTEENLRLLGHGALMERLATLGQGARIIVAAAGNVDPEQLVQLSDAVFGDLPRGECPIPLTPVPAAGSLALPSPFSQGFLFSARPWPGLCHPNYLLGLVVASAFGQGPSSRLFQVLREERALTYDIDASIDSFPCVGALVVSGAFEKALLSTAEALIAEETERLRLHGLSREEFDRTVRSLAAQLEMEHDSLRAQLWRLVDSEQYFARYVSTEEVRDRLLAIPYEVTQCFIDEWFDPATEFRLVLGGER